MIEANVEDYFMVKFYCNDNNNSKMKQKANSRLVDNWSLTGLLARIQT